MDTWKFEPSLGYLTDTKWHPGDLIPVKWNVIGDSMTQSDPVPVALTMSILGPATTITEAKHLVESGGTPISTKQMFVTDQTAMLNPEELQVPTDIAPGAYGVVAYVERDEHRIRQAVTIIEIVK
jgi:hypothetical protein